MRKFIAAIWIVLMLLVISGCSIMPEASVPYRYRLIPEDTDTLMLKKGESQVVQGREHRFLDWVGHNIISLPSKLMLWNWDVANHDITPETKEALVQYLSDNNLHNVKVRLNNYSPGAEWRRLFANRSIHPFWRYTLGVISVTQYTIIPGRFFAGFLSGDNYNPFTNTINLYSDSHAIALHEGAHAKDFADEENKGTYAAMRLLPIVPLIQESKATSDALGYLIAKNKSEEEMDKAFEILYPAYGSYVFGAGLFGATYDYIPVDAGIKFAANVVGVGIGHIAGRDEPTKTEKSGTSTQLALGNDKTRSK